MSENGSLLSMDDVNSERVRFDDNVSFIDEKCSGSSMNGVVSAAGGIEDGFESGASTSAGIFGGKMQKVSAWFPSSASLELNMIKEL